MKKTGFTIVFVIACIGILVAAYGIGVCIRKIRFRAAQAETAVTTMTDQPGTQTKPEGGVKKPTPSAGDRESEGELPRPRMGGPGGIPGMPTREELENMSEEERRAAIAQMRDRFGGRRREGGPQLSEEDRAKMREEIEAIRERWEEMSDEEKEKVEAEFREKYGFFPSPDGRRAGGGFGGRRGSRQRARPNDGQ